MKHGTHNGYRYHKCRCSACRKCHNAYQLKRYHANSEAVHAARILKKYGVTKDWFEKTSRKQKGLCAICQEAKPERRLSVDHDHITLRVRGLLCRRCNGSLGWFEAYRERILQYLEV